MNACCMFIRSGTVHTSHWNIFLHVFVCMHVVHVHTKRDIRTVMKYKQMRHITFCMVGNIGGELRTLGRSVSQPTRHAVPKIIVYIEMNYLDR